MPTAVVPSLCVELTGGSNRSLVGDGVEWLVASFLVCRFSYNVRTNQWLPESIMLVSSNPSSLAESSWGAMFCVSVDRYTRHSIRTVIDTATLVHNVPLTQSEIELLGWILNVACLRSTRFR